MHNPHTDAWEGDPEEAEDEALDTTLRPEGVHPAHVARGDLVVLRGEWTLITRSEPDGSAWHVHGTTLEDEKEVKYRVDPRRTPNSVVPALTALALSQAGVDPGDVVKKLRMYLRQVGAAGMLARD